MRRLDYDKLHVEFFNDVINSRKYTLTHSDDTGELFLTIALKYDYDKISPMRDEVLAEWKSINDTFVLYVYVYVDGNYGATDYKQALRRNDIFIRELPTALEAIRHGDQSFFEAHPKLDKSPIYVHFVSIYPHLNRIEHWGTPSDYD